MRLQPVDLMLEILGCELEPDGSADFPPAIRVPREDEEGLLFEDEKRAVSVLPLIIGRSGPVSEQPRVEVDGTVEIRHVQVDCGDDAHDRLACGAAARVARAFFLRWRSFLHRLIGLEPLPMD
jgi:hypothetical protein